MRQTSAGRCAPAADGPRTARRRQRTRAAMRVARPRRSGSPRSARAGSVRRRPPRPCARTSPTTPKVDRRGARRARRRSSSTWTTVAPAADQPAVPHRPHVQRAAPADDQVGAADQLGGQRRGEAAGDVERPRVAREQALGDGRRRQQRAAALGERLQRRAGSRRRGRRGRPRRPAARAARERLGEPADAVRVGSGRRAPAGQPGPRPDAAGTSRGLHVQRQVEHDGPALVAAPSQTAAARLADRVVRRRRRARAPRRRPRPAPPGRRRSSTAAGSPRRPATTSGVRLLAASVMPVIALVSPQPWCTVTAATVPAHPGVGVGHRRRAALVPGGDEPGARRDHRVGDVEVAGADDAEDLADAELGQRSDADDVRADRRHALDQRQHPRRAARSRRRSAAARRSAPRRSAGSRREVLQLGQAVLAAAHQERVARERRVEGVRGAGVGADRLDARRRSPAPPRPPSGRTPAEMPGVCGPVSSALRKSSWSSRPGVPAGAVEQPAAVGQRPVLGLPGAGCARPRAGSRGPRRHRRGEVEHDGRARSAGRPAPTRRRRRPCR